MWCVTRVYPISSPSNLQFTFLCCSQMFTIPHFPIFVNTTPGNNTTTTPLDPCLGKPLGKPCGNWLENCPD